MLVFVTGAASLGAEITASRLLAPAFGTSLVVWSNVIGVVLLCLSVGYLVGGRLADRFPRRGPLYAVAAAAGVMIALSPVSAAALETIVPRGAGELAGSFTAAGVLLGLPATLLGCVSPWAIRLVLADVRASGREAGRLYALSTAGSLAGSYLPVLALLPTIGTSATFQAVGGVLAAVAVLGLIADRDAPRPDSGRGRAAVTAIT